MTDESRRSHDDRRPTADEMLDLIRRQAGSGARGRLRVYLGMAPGVGKTYAMLMEAHRRKERGTDVVIGFVETYGRPHTIEAIGDLEVIPRQQIAYKGVTIEEMDTAAVIARGPDVALVDELAHTNAPGSKHEKRWEDVQELLESGITVLSTMNVQHVESLADIVESITGVEVRERIPDQVIDEADEVELVDMSPNALRQRIKHGNVYPPDRAEQALEHFFREGNLGALRELALRRVSTKVEEDLEDYMRQHEVPTVWPAGERVMVCVSSEPSGQRLIRRAWRVASRFRAEAIAVFVETANWARAAPEDRRSLEANLRFAEDLGVRVLRVPGRDVPGTLASVAKEKNAGMIILGHSRRGWLRRLVGGQTVERLLELTPGADVLVVSDREHG